jgi:prepilin-type N-terminal cleavage/methylation domain-containing protein
MSSHPSHSKRGRQRDAGFTLVELLISVTILSFGLLSVASLLLTAVTLNSLGKSTNEGLAYARDKMEALKALPSDSTQRDVGGSLTSDSTGYFDTVGTFKRRWQISTGPVSTKTYTVSVIPLNADARRNKTVTLTTIF